MKNKELILSPYFIGGVFILLLNDFYLKQEMGNFLTGKLSDFAGLLVFPMFIAVLAPRLKRTASLITGIGFILWKLPLMTPVIDFFNHVTGLGLFRVLDYTDYMALAILPLSHYLINREGKLQLISFSVLKTVSRFALLVISFFSFCATSFPYMVHEMPQGTLYIGESYDIKLPKDSVIRSIQGMNYNCDYHDDLILHHRSGTFANDTASGYYQTDNIICNWKELDPYRSTIDTIAHIKYFLDSIKPNKTRLVIINVDLLKEGQMQNWRLMRDLSEQYNKWLKKKLIKKID